MNERPQPQAMKHVRQAPRVQDGVEMGSVPVRVSLMRSQDATYWHNQVQPLIAAATETRADRNWDWRLFRRVLPLVQHLQRRRCLALTTVAENDQAEAVPVAMHLLIERYPHLSDWNLGATFVWFMCAMPKDVFTRFDISGVPPSLGRVCVDVALMASRLLGLEGRIGLHCAPTGGPRLMSFYKKHCRLLNLAEHLPLPPFHGNDGRFFYTEDELAKELLAELEHLRE